jgi:hypothetical protein
MQYVYGLFDPRNDQVKYIGRTSNPQARLNQHLNYGTQGKKKIAWIEELEAVGLEPYLDILETATDETIIDTENFYIDYFLMLGAELTNSYRRDKPKTIILKKKPKTILLSLDKDLVARIDAKAYKDYTTRSAIVRAACRRELGLPY